MTADFLITWGFITLLVGSIVWMFYMMTFRTSDFIALAKADEERRRRIAAQRARHLDQGLRFVSWWFKR
jgi:hypothetical protein